MPLMKKRSEKAFKHNIEAEMHAGKPQKQSIAIAYSIKRKSPKKKASGGSVQSGSKDMNMAKGGSIEEGPSEKENQSGVNRIVPNYDRKHNEIKHGQSEARYGNKKAEHQRVLEELQRMPKPRLAEGGSISASNEKRPMPDNEYDDKMMASHNKARKALKDSDWTDSPTVAQAQKNNGRAVMPIKRPKMVPSDAFSTRLYDKEGMLEESAKPGPYGEQPERDMDEEGPDRQGPKVRDMSDEHSTKAKPYAKGGEVSESEQFEKENPVIGHKHAMKLYKEHGQSEEEYHKNKHEFEHPKGGVDTKKLMGHLGYAKGGEIEASDKRHPMNKYEDDLTDLHPSHDEGMDMADEHDEEGQDRQGPSVMDMEDEHSTGRKPYAGGGKISDFHEDHDEEMNPAHDMYSMDDSEDQPDQEEDEEHHNSIAAAIMANREAKKYMMSDSDIDEMLHLYEGGEISERRGKIKSHGSMDSDDSDQADLSRNADEDANEEDQASFRSLEKENYSESEGLRQLDNPRDAAMKSDDEEMDSHDRHDMVSAIRRKMKKKQF